MRHSNPSQLVSPSAPSWALGMRRITDYLSQDCLGGPRPWKAAWVYLALHGSYGLVWILKDLAFPDPNWQKKVTILGGINSFLFVLGWYWVFGWLLISGTLRPVYPLPDVAWFALCITPTIWMK